MKSLGRLLYLLLLLLGLVVAWRRLGEQDVAIGDVALTGLLFALGLLAFFGLLLGLGRLLGRLVKDDDE